MEKKKKTKNKKRFTWVNLAQLLTVAALGSRFRQGAYDLRGVPDFHRGRGH
jgi:hypothetical protein